MFRAESQDSLSDDQFKDSPARSISSKIRVDMADGVIGGLQE